MISRLIFTAAWVACLAKSNEYYSFSPPVGLGSGSTFSSSGEGGITGIKVWENPSSYITGFQLRYGTKWSKVIGRTTTSEVRLDLFEGEAIIQVSGKYNPSNYIYQLAFGTSKGRFLCVGQPTQRSFNFFAKHVEAELRMLSGRFNGNGITSVGAHWGVVYMDDSAEEGHQVTVKPKH